jgi:hypothetical protein
MVAMKMSEEIIDIVPVKKAKQLKGTGFSPYIEPAKKERALAPEVCSCDTAQ